MQDLAKQKASPERHHLGCGCLTSLFSLIFAEFLVIAPLGHLLRYGHWISLPSSKGGTSYSFDFSNEGIHLCLLLGTFSAVFYLYRAWELRLWRDRHPLNPRAQGLRIANDARELAEALKDTSSPLLAEFESRQEAKQKGPFFWRALLLLPVLLYFGGKLADMLYLGTTERYVVAVLCLAWPLKQLHQFVQEAREPKTLDHRQLIDFARREIYQLNCNSLEAPVLLARFDDLKAIELVGHNPDVLVCIIRFKVRLLGLEEPMEFGPAALNPEAASLVAERLSLVLKLPVQKAPDFDAPTLQRADQGEG